MMITMKMTTIDDDDVTSGEVVRLRKVDLQGVTFVSTVRKVDR